MTITSQEAFINASSEQVFLFLCDCQNIYHLLPHDKISDWMATVDDCSFTIQKMAIIPLVIIQREANQSIVMKSGDKAPFPFTLKVVILEKGQTCSGYIEFEGQVNAFLKMMVDKPLTNLFEYMTQKLKAHFEK